MIVLVMSMDHLAARIHVGALLAFAGSRMGLLPRFPRLLAVALMFARLLQPSTSSISLGPCQRRRRRLKGKWRHSSTVSGGTSESPH